MTINYSALQDPVTIPPTIMGFTFYCNFDERDPITDELHDINSLTGRVALSLGIPRISVWIQPFTVKEYPTIRWAAYISSVYEKRAAAALAAYSARLCQPHE